MEGRYLQELGLESWSDALGFALGVIEAEVVGLRGGLGPASDGRVGVDDDLGLGLVPVFFDEADCPVGDDGGEASVEESDPEVHGQSPLAFELKTFCRRYFTFDGGTWGRPVCLGGGLLRGGATHFVIVI